MTSAWAFFFLAALVVLCGGAMIWAGEIRRRRHYEDFILRNAKRAGGKQ
ncbi:hypothetical protein N5C70_15110 [Pseudomonas juntendi]|uniref:Heme exporter protein D n=1 Tax=Pseudomonas juntendi TaxID=2666183 RepID=A0ABD4YFA3_9PSED|nr:hypothetical protein [Pseudomonas juntendi]MDH0758029.1 hypothetical protein [Pseudomonas juntendi]MDH1919529.1 hypothetical protein [Pseudomonas juntendi]